MRRCAVHLKISALFSCHGASMLLEAGHRVEVTSPEQFPLDLSAAVYLNKVAKWKVENQDC